MARTHFYALSEELVHTIFKMLLVFNEPLEVTYGFRPGLKLAVSHGCTLLRVSKHFFRIAEYLLYRYNTFEFKYDAFWLFDFHFEINRRAESVVSKIRIQWPKELVDIQTCLQTLVAFRSLALLEITDFPYQATKSLLRSVDKLPIKEIRFEKRAMVNKFQFTTTFALRGLVITRLNPRTHQVSSRYVNRAHFD